MKRCPITYEVIETGKYSKGGLRLLSRQLETLSDFGLTPKEQIEKAQELATKLSIQGVQPKLSAKLDVKTGSFEVVERGGKFIIKPPHHFYEELPQNEDLTMKLAHTVGLEVPLHGMIYNIDQSLSYFIKRFDRLEKNIKIAVEDFSQLMGHDRDTKYDSSMEKIAYVIENFCTFPKVEKLKLFRLIIFNFLIGNEDMHLKNYSLITQNDIIKLSPAYDLINTTIVLKGNEEIALPLRGKKSKLTSSDLIEYFGIGRLSLSPAQINLELENFKKQQSHWIQLISNSFLSRKFKDDYLNLLNSRKLSLNL